MTDLQFGLVVIGVVAVVGVFAYNRFQEGSARREAEKAFGSRHADVLLDGKETTSPPPQEAPRSRGGSLPAEAAPDPRVDYIIRLEGGSRPSRDEWAPLERRFARRALVGEADGDAWIAALQLVNRSGVTSEVELIEFRSGIETLAVKLGASVSAPEMREALHAAGELDGLCADADIQVALHVDGASAPQNDLHAGQPYQITSQGTRVTFTLDVPRVREVGRSYEAMSRAALQLAASAGGQLVDDNGKPVDERTLAAIGAQLDAVSRGLAQAGIEPGSPLALRLFS
jgi:hypothetical protein